MSESSEPENIRLSPDRNSEPASADKESSRVSSQRDKGILFAFSIVLLCGTAAVTFINPYFSAQQWFTYTCILALSAGGFAAFLPGAIEWQVSPQMRATGAIALVVLVLFLGSKVEGKEVQSRKWSLVPPSGGDAPSPDDAVVYVSLDERIVKASGPSPTFKAVDSTAGRDIIVERGSGGIIVQVPRTSAGQRLFVLIEDQSKWWISREVIIPPTDRLDLRPTTIEAVRKRIQ